MKQKVATLQAQRQEQQIGFEKAKRQALQEGQNEKRALTEALLQTRGDLSQACQQVEELTAQLAASREFQESTVQRAQQDVSEAQEQLRQKILETEDIQKRLEEAEDQKKKHQMQLQLMDKKWKQWEEVARQNSELHAFVTSLKRENDRLILSLEKKNVCLRSLEEKNVALNNQVSQFHSALQQAEHLSSSRAGQLQELNSQVEMSELCLRLQSSEQRAETMATHCEAMEMELRMAQADNNQIKACNQELQTLLEETQQAVWRAEQQMTSLETALKEEAVTLRQEVASLQRKLESQEEERKDLLHERELYEQQLRDLEKKKGMGAPDAQSRKKITQELEVEREDMQEVLDHGTAAALKKRGREEIKGTENGQLQTWAQRKREMAKGTLKKNFVILERKSPDNSIGQSHLQVLQEGQNEKRALTEALLQTRGDLSQACQQVEELTAQLAASREFQESTVQRAQQDVSEAQEELQQKILETEDIQKRLEEAEDQKKELQMQLQLMDKKWKQWEEVARQNSELQAFMQLLDSENNRLILSLEKKNVCLRSLEEKNVALNNQLSQLHSALQQAEHLSSSHAGQLQELNSQVEMSELRLRLQSSEERAEAMATHCEAMEMELRMAQADYNQIKACNQELQTLLEETQQAVWRAEHQKIFLRTGLKEEATALKKEAVTVRQEMEYLRRKLESQEKERKDVLHERELYEQQLRVLEKKKGMGAPDAQSRRKISQELEVEREDMQEVLDHGTAAALKKRGREEIKGTENGQLQTWAQRKREMAKGTLKKNFVILERKSPDNSIGQSHLQVLQEGQNEKKALTKALLQTRGDLSQACQQVEELTSQLAASQEFQESTVQRAQQDVSEAQEQLQQKILETEDIQKRLEEVEDQKKELQMQLQLMDKNWKQWEEVARQNSELQAFVQLLDSENNRLILSLEKKNVCLRSLEEKNVALNNQLSQLHSALQQAEHLSSSHAGQLQELNSQVEMSELRLRLQSSEERAETMATHCEAMEMELRMAQADYNQIKACNQELQTLLEETQQAVWRAEHQKIFLRTGLKDEATALKKEAVTVRQEMEYLRRKLESQEKERKDVLHERELYEQQLRVLEKKKGMGAPDAQSRKKISQELEVEREDMQEVLDHGTAAALKKRGREEIKGTENGQLQTWAQRKREMAKGTLKKNFVILERKSPDNSVGQSHLQVSLLQSQLARDRQHRQNYIESCSRTSQELSDLHQELSCSFAAVLKEPKAALVDAET
ncbi:cingulin-like protein 1 [Poecile atricapillus]|uniref:cingulin-like protein 1 n=1 Tax=Poecile atricapillus TaxID=48891 RepID=UPI0027391AF7|nr:cingulin-like protein 1 [Poecile atricapillus]